VNKNNPPLKNLLAPRYRFLAHDMYIVNRKKSKKNFFGAQVAKSGIL
jgi:hypothetical protein